MGLAGTGFTTAPTVTFVGGGASNSPTAYATLTNTINYDLQQKALLGGFEKYYGRMSANLGTGAVTYYYDDPPTDIWQDSITVSTPVANDGTQIWRINPIGVDTHILHWHLFNLQVINRIGLDGVIRPPDPSELGWKESIKINPFEVLIVAARPVDSAVALQLPDSIRPLSPSMPIGSTSEFTNITPAGTATSITNQLFNFGWEYVWHCHILTHEENDMMRPMSFYVNTSVPAAPTLSVSTAGGNVLTWTDATPPTAANINNPANEVGFNIFRGNGSGGGVVLSQIGTAPANTTNYTDGTAIATNTYTYMVQSWNVAGTNNSTSHSVTTATTIPIPPAPTTLNTPVNLASVNITSPIPFAWSSVSGATSYTLHVLSGTVDVVNMPGLIANDINVPVGVLKAGPYTWKVSSTGTGWYLRQFNCIIIHS